MRVLGVYARMSKYISVHLYKQAAFDIAAAIGGSFAKGICHQDVSPFNMILYKNRVFLTDWSAGKVSIL